MTSRSHLTNESSPAVDPATTESLIACLNSGGVILVPTDTVYGLGVHPEHDEAIDRLFALKRRPRSRQLPIMVANPADLPTLGAIVTDAARLLLDAFAPGPLTLAFGVDPASAPGWLRDRDEIAVRIPDDELLLAVLSATGPVLMTSANLHAQTTPEDLASILAMLAGRPDTVVDGGPRSQTASTLVNVNLSEPAIERSGTIPDDEIWKVLRG
jgi:L-threonylcarbamoyladenylate synthase